MAYYHELSAGGPDMLLSVFGYSEDESETTAHVRNWGYGGRVALATRDGMLRASYQYEHGESFKGIHTVGMNLSVGFRLENLLAMESPIEKPTPIFSSPRNLNYWQGAAPGTDRHLRKNSLGSSKCLWGDCKDCWDRVKVVPSQNEHRMEI